MKVAIVHYWLVGMRGGEKVVEALCRMYPDADIFTHVYDPERVSPEIRRHKVTTTFINRLPKAKRLYKKYLPLMPLALEQLDLRGYDLIISSESGPAKGIIPPPGSVHICYCHSPMRYIWSMFHDYRGRSGLLTRMLMPFLAHYIRTWDSVTSNRVDHYIANSDTVAERLHRYYRRASSVIHPPVAVDYFEVLPPEEVEDSYLLVSELVAYKRPDIAIEAFNRTGRKLVVIGDGEMLGAIRKMAGPNIEVLGRQPDEVLRHHYARTRALIFPGEEDFGIVPVEAMASGRPVIAFNRGGATETVVHGRTGILFDEQSVEDLIHAVETARAIDWDSAEISAHAAKFAGPRFEREIASHIARLVQPTSRQVMRIDNGSRRSGALASVEA